MEGRVIWEQLESWKMCPSFYPLPVLQSSRKLITRTWPETNWHKKKREREKRTRAPVWSARGGPGTAVWGPRSTRSPLRTVPRGGWVSLTPLYRWGSSSLGRLRNSPMVTWLVSDQKKFKLQRPATGKWRRPALSKCGHLRSLNPFSLRAADLTPPQGSTDPHFNCEQAELKKHWLSEQWS